VSDSTIRTLMDVFKKAAADGYARVTVVCGEDRRPSFEKIARYKVFTLEDPPKSRVWIPEVIPPWLLPPNMARYKPKGLRSIEVLALPRDAKEEDDDVEEGKKARGLARSGSSTASATKQRGAAHASADDLGGEKEKKDEEEETEETEEQEASWLARSASATKQRGAALADDLGSFRAGLYIYYIRIPPSLPAVCGFLK